MAKDLLDYYDFLILQKLEGEHLDYYLKEIEEHKDDELMVRLLKNIYKEDIKQGRMILEKANEYKKTIIGRIDFLEESLNYYEKKLEES